MAQLGKQAITRLELPSTAGLPEAERSWVDINTNVAMEHLLGSETYATEAEKSVYGLSQLIVDWNFTIAAADGSEQKAPISYDTIKRLGITDFAFLNKWLLDRLETVQAGLPPDVKKN